MFDILALLCLLGAIGLLVALSVIDLKDWILPDELNFAFGLTGLLFHFFTGYMFLDIQEIVIGGLLGAGILYVIRFFANRHYERDTLGLGDVKLLGAAGLWLGIDGVLQAVTLGALAGLLHGIGYAANLNIKNKTPFTISNLSIPAGPGFAVGIVAVGAHMFLPYVEETVRDFLA